MDGTCGWVMGYGWSVCFCFLLFCFLGSYPLLCAVGYTILARADADHVLLFYLFLVLVNTR
jgi:hypothetical protein